MNTIIMFALKIALSISLFFCPEPPPKVSVSMGGIVCASHSQTGLEFSPSGDIRAIIFRDKIVWSSTPRYTFAPSTIERFSNGIPEMIPASVFSGQAVMK